MGLYKQRGSKNYWYDFRFAGERHRDTTKTANKTLAKEVEDAVRRRLHESLHGIRRPEKPKLFPAAADEFLAARRGNVADSTLEIHKRAIENLRPFFGKKYLIDITAGDIKKFQQARLAAMTKSGKPVTPRGVNIDVGVLRSVLRRSNLWDSLRHDISMLREPDSAGRALTADEERRLLAACKASISRGLYTAA